MGRKKYPKTTEEAFEIIDAMLSDEDKKAFIKQKASDFACEQHFGLGIWVRNNWIYKGDVPTCVLTGEKPAEINDGKLFPLLLTVPDDVSHKFLELYHKHLKKTYKIEKD